VEKYEHVVQNAILCHAFIFIEGMAKSEIVDRSAFLDQENSIYFPFRDVTYLYGEYEHVCKNRNDPICASLSTFRRAYTAVEKKLWEEGYKLKLSGGKGMFN
jgi:hypothetical protein